MDKKKLERLIVGVLRVSHVCLDDDQTGIIHNKVEERRGFMKREPNRDCTRPSHHGFLFKLNWS